NRVHVKVSGTGRLLGLDNGDSTDYDQYKGTSRRLFNGKLMAIIGSVFEAGEVQVTVSSIGMEPAVIQFTAHPASDEEKAGRSVHGRNTDMPIVMGPPDEIPVRKIEITSDGGQKLSESLQEVTVRAKLYPGNTSYTDVEWSAVTDTGIRTNIAKVEASGLEA